MTATEAEIIWDLLLASVVVTFWLSMYGFYTVARDAIRLIRRWRAMR